MSTKVSRGGKSRSAVAVAPVALVEPVSTHTDPPNDLRWKAAAQVHQNSARQVADMVQAGQLRIPVFQRKFVWDDEHVLYLLDSLLQGFYVGNVTLWEQYDLPVKTVDVAGVEAQGTKRGYLVVDGQQRIGSIARAFLTPRYAFDFMSMKFVVASEPARDRIPLHFMVANILRILDGVKNDLWSPEQAGWLTDNLVYRQVCSTILPHTWGVADVMEMFRRMNTAGIRMASSDVEAALQKARQG